VLAAQADIGKPHCTGPGNEHGVQRQKLKATSQIEPGALFTV
jgi:hypothetical protein